jgi:hypothetical protein
MCLLTHGAGSVATVSLDGAETLLFLITEQPPDSLLMNRKVWRTYLEAQQTMDSFVRIVRI